MNVSPDYLADTLRRIEARRARRPAAPIAKPKPDPPKIMGYYGTIEQVNGVDRRPYREDPMIAVNSAIDGIVDQALGHDNQDGQVETEDATIGNEETLRGIPAVGRVSGTMKFTDPARTTMARLSKRTPRHHDRIAS